MSRLFRHASLQDRAAAFESLVQEPGWQMLQQQFRAEIKTRISDQDAKEAFLFEAIRAQVIQEIFATPVWTIQEADKQKRKTEGYG